MTDVLQVTVTTGDRETAIELARSATQARLAAGGNISGPDTSFFWHLGEYGEGEEWHLRLHTTRERYQDLETHLHEHHPWNNPEISAVELAAGSATFLKWVVQTLGNA